MAAAQNTYISIDKIAKLKGLKNNRTLRIAINIDSDIVQKIPDVRVITVSIHTGLKYYFRKPCPMKILEEIHINNKLYKEYCEKFERATHSEMK